MTEFTEKLKAYLNEEDRFCRVNGIALTRLEEGYAEAELELGPNAVNGLGAAQGGVIFTLADLALAGAANSHGVPAVTQSATISYLRPGSGRRLKATAREVNRGRRTGLYEIDVHNDAGKLVARVLTGVFFLDEKFPFSD